MTRLLLLALVLVAGCSGQVTVEGLYAATILLAFGGGYLWGYMHGEVRGERKAYRIGKGWFKSG